MIYPGSHLSSSGGFRAMGEQALRLGETSFAWFTRNPRGGRAKSIDPEDAAALRGMLADHGFGPLVAHAPYTMNLCSAKPEVREFARSVLLEDMDRTAAVPGQFYNLHPGSHTGQGTEAGIEQIAEALREALPRARDTGTTILLETMAGKGSEVGGTFGELAAIIELCGAPENLGVCFDTCHVWDAGYDIVSARAEVLAEFDRVIGLDRLRAVHMNDSKNPCGAHKDRHEKIGLGAIGLEGLRAIAVEPALQGRPFILETPNDDDGWAEEVRVIRSWF